MKQLSGPEGIREVFDAALAKNCEGMLRTALADVPLVQYAGEAYTKDFVERRKQLGIKLKSLRLNGQGKETPDINDLHKQIKTITLPEKIYTSMVLWDDNVVLVGKDAETITWITDKDHAQMMKEWYERLWQANFREKWSKSFLRVIKNKIFFVSKTIKENKDFLSFATAILALLFTGLSMKATDELNEKLYRPYASIESLDIGSITNNHYSDQEQDIENALLDIKIPVKNLGQVPLQIIWSSFQMDDFVKKDNKQIIDLNAEGFFRNEIIIGSGETKSINTDFLDSNLVYDDFLNNIQQKALYATATIRYVYPDQLKGEYYEHRATFVCKKDIDILESNSFVGGCYQE